jgi:hypothetical protein
MTNMGDVGDYWRDARAYRRSVRAHWHECPTCAQMYGTGTKVPPGCECHNCGWLAPGEVTKSKSAGVKPRKGG